VVKNNVEDDAQTCGVGRRHQIDQITAVAETGVYLQEILNAIAVISIEMAALLKDRAEPDRGHAEPFQIAQFGLDAPERATLPALPARLRPAVPAPGYSIYLWAGRVEVPPIQGRSCCLLTIAEAIDQEKIKHLISPIRR
jgi:hypothetical protein